MVDTEPLSALNRGQTVEKVMSRLCIIVSIILNSYDIMFFCVEFLPLILARPMFQM